MSYSFAILFFESIEALLKLEKKIILSSKALEF